MRVKHRNPPWILVSLLNVFSRPFQRPFIFPLDGPRSSHLKFLFCKLMCRLQIAHLRPVCRQISCIVGEVICNIPWHHMLCDCQMQIKVRRPSSTNECKKPRDYVYQRRKIFEHWIIFTVLFTPLVIFQLYL